MKKSTEKMKISARDIWARITDDTFRYYFQMCILCAVLGTVSLIMGIMNIFTGKTVLMYATLSFAVIMYINFFILWRQGRTSDFTYLVFECGMLVLFTYFLLTGGTEGFSPHWIIILPSCGLMFLGKKRGLWLNVIMLAIILFMLLTPWGIELQMYKFTKEFCMRFPVVYVSAFVLGFCFEEIRVLTYKALIEAQEKLTIAAETDPLTKLHNRHWFNQRLYDRLDQKTADRNCAVAIIDIDKFKVVNDVHGHLSGDEALISTAHAIDSCMKDGDSSCRWGGEEFFIYLDNCAEDQLQERCEEILDTVRKIELTDTYGVDYKITVSIGAVGIVKGQKVDLREVFLKSDERLYRAKDTGRNRAVTK